MLSEVCFTTMDITQLPSVLRVSVDVYGCHIIVEGWHCSICMALSYSHYLQADVIVLLCIQALQRGAYAKILFSFLLCPNEISPLFFGLATMPLLIYPASLC